MSGRATSRSDGRPAVSAGGMLCATSGSGAGGDERALFGQFEQFDDQARISGGLSREVMAAAAKRLSDPIQDQTMAARIAAFFKAKRS